MADNGTVDLRLDQAHSARMYDYYLGGTTNFPADREAAYKALAAFPPSWPPPASTAVSCNAPRGSSPSRA